MSDQKTPSAGEPVDEPGSVDDVVGRANEGLAEAEAAQRDSVTPETTTHDGAETPQETAASDADEDVPWYDRPESVPMDPEPTPAAAAYAGSATREPVVEDRPAATDDRATERVPVAETAYAPPAAEAAYSAPQPIFVQAPEAPRPLGNRGAVGAIGLLAALSFAVLSFAIIFGYGFATGTIDSESLVAQALAIVSNPVFWVPVIVFYLAFWLLGAVLNRARWAHWVIWGLLVGVASYGGYLLGVLFAAPFWELTAREGRELLESQLFSPLAILAFVLGRELTIWFGAWAAKRAGRITELNEQAQREYERTLEAGPQLVHA